MYCYLKARFGEPNGFQTFVAKDDSDNWIHWDYNLKAGCADLHISGMSRETHIMTSESLSDEQWRDLVVNIKADFARVGREKSNVLKSLEKWAVFQNKFVEIANACAGKHAIIADFLANKPGYFSLKAKSKRDGASSAKEMSERNKLRADMAQACLELSLLTPVMAEAFINMTILMLCKPEVRENNRQFEVFIRSQIDAKIFDLPYKCTGFLSGIDPASPAFVNFKRVMDKRNHEIHGNIDPEREKIEVVYFDNKRPLFSVGKPATISASSSDRSKGRPSRMSSSVITRIRTNFWLRSSRASRETFSPVSGELWTTRIPATTQNGGRRALCFLDMYSLEALKVLNTTETWP